MKKRMILLDVLLCILITFTAACFSIKPLVVKTISTDMSGTAISHQFMDFVYKEFPNAASNDMLMVQNKLAESKAIENITAKYIDQIIKNRGKTGTLYTSPKDIDRLRDEAISIIEGNIGIKITDTQKQSLQNMIDEHKDTMISQLESTISYFGSMASNPQYGFLFQLYAIGTSLLFQFVCVLLSIACAYLLIRQSSLEKAVYHIAICFIISAVCLYAVIPNIADSILATLANHILGRTTFFNFSPMKTAGMILIILAVIAGIIGLFLHHKDVNTQETIHLA